MSTAIHMTGALDPRREWKARHCPLAKSLEVVHTRSAFLILREAFYGATRFEEFVEQTELSEPITSARLRELTEAEILRREPYREPGQRTRDLYRLTAKGTELLPVLVALMQWGDRWLQDSPDPVELHHHECGETVTAEIRCRRDHVVAPGEIDLIRRSDARG